MRPPPHVFISYSHAQKAELRALTDELDVLEAEGHLTYWADTALKPGDKWDDVIRAEVRRADVVVGLITTDWLKSPYVRTSELDGVKAGDQRFVGAVVDACTWGRVQWLASLQVMFADTELLDGDARAQKKRWVKLAEAIHDAAEEVVKAREGKEQADKERADKERAEKERAEKERAEKERAEWVRALQASLEQSLRTTLAGRAKHLRLVSLTVDQTAPGRANWRAELDVGAHAAAFAAQLGLIGRFDDLKKARRSPAGEAVLDGSRVVETGEVTFAAGAGGAVDPATLRFRSHLFEDLAAMLSVTKLKGIANEKQVTLPAYDMGKFQVTQALYEIVAGDNPSRFEGESLRPVEQVSWYDAVRFCNGLSQLTGRPEAYKIGGGEQPSVARTDHADGFRLPSEAEWEVACRAGTTTEFYWGDDEAGADSHAWFHGSSKGTTHPVGEKKPNGNGLHHTAGNVWEWCFDPWDRDSPDRVVRGGSWFLEPGLLRAAVRFRFGPGNRGDNLGFRCASSPPRAAVAP